MAERSALLSEAEDPDGEGSPADALRRELEAHTVKELRALAKAGSVNLHGKTRKDDIVALLVAARTGPEAEEDEASPEDEAFRVEEPPFGRLEDLWIETATRLMDGDARSALAFSREGLVSSEGWMREYRESMCTMALEATRRFLARYGSEDVQALQDQLEAAREALDGGDLDACVRRIEALQETLTDVHLNQAGRVRERLAAQEETLKRLEGVGLDLEEARGILSRAEEASRLDRYGHALELLQQVDAVVRQARQGRMDALRDRLRGVESRMAEAESLGAPLEECQRLLGQAWTAFRQEDLVLSGELTRRVEQAVMEAQKRQIERALQLRKGYIAEVRELVTYLKPILREADAYDLEVQRARDLLRDSLELLRQEDYFGALEHGEAARTSLVELVPQLVEERGRRGVEPPGDAQCRECGSRSLTFHDDGWGVCESCGSRFVWSTRDLTRIITFLRKRLTP